MKYKVENLRHLDGDPQFYVFDNESKIVLAVIDPIERYNNVFTVIYHSDMPKGPEKVVGKQAAIHVASLAVVDWIEAAGSKSAAFREASDKFDVLAFSREDKDYDVQNNY